MKNMNSSIFTFHGNRFAFFAFLLIYFLDPLFYVLSSDFSFPKISVGIIGILLGCLLLLFFSYKQKINYIILLLFAIFGGLFLSISFSNHSEFIDYWIVITMISYTTIGYFLSKNLFDNKSNLDKRFKLLIVILIPVSLFVSIFFLKNLGSADLQSVYLRPGHAIAVSSIFCFYYIKDKNLTLSFIFISCMLMALLFINSRSTILGVLFALFVTEFFSSKKSLKFIYIILIPSLLLLFVTISSYLFKHGYDGVGHRFIRLIGAISQDTSLQARDISYEYGEIYFYKGFSSLGNYKYYYNSLGDGAYIHDARSYVAEFGIFGLALLALKSYVFFKYILTYKGAFLTDFRVSIIFSLVLYASLNMFFVQHFTYSTTFLIFGMAMFIINNRPLAKVIYSQS